MQNIETLIKITIEPTIFSRNDCTSRRIRLKPKKSSAALIPNNKKLTHGTFRVTGNLAKTREELMKARRLNRNPSQTGQFQRSFLTATSGDQRPGSGTMFPFRILRIPSHCMSANSNTTSATIPTIHFPVVLKGTTKRSG